MRHLIKLIALLLICNISSAYEPNRPHILIDDEGNIAKRVQSLPTKWGQTYPYWNASAEKIHSDGWRAAQIVDVIDIITNDIPAEIQSVANTYKLKMEELFGQDSYKNTNLTESVVAISLLSNTNITAEEGLRLKTQFEILNKWWKRGEIWSFPWDQQYYIKTNITKSWQIIEE